MRLVACYVKQKIASMNRFYRRLMAVNFFTQNTVITSRLKNTAGKFSVLLGLLLLCQCASRPITMPVVDLDHPDWQIWTGQTRWQPPKGAPAVSGDIILARNLSGDVFIQLEKSPVTLFSAQTNQNLWRLKTIQSDKAYSGRGKAPKQFIWFYLPSLLAKQAPLTLKHWQIHEHTDDFLSMSNTRTGESIRLALDENNL